MSIISTSQTGFPYAPFVLSSISDEDQVTQVPLNRFSDEMITQPNRGQEIFTQTQSSSREWAFSENGGSALLGVNLGELEIPQIQIRFPKVTFQTLQKWQGTVIEISPDTFLAVLTSIDGEEIEQEAEIYLNEVEEEDRYLVKPGAIFYWSIGYLNRPSGRIRASMIRFRRVPKWSKQDVNAAKNRAESLRKSLFGE